MEGSARLEEHSVYQGALDRVRHLADVPMKITIILGRRRMKVRELLQLRSDSILELPKSAGENVDIYVNDRPVGYGEVLEMEGRAGIRLTDIYTQT